MSSEKVRKGQDVAVMLLARGFSRTKVAKAAGVSERTIYKYLKDPLFRRRVDELRNEFRDQAVGVLTAMSNKMLKTLWDLLDSDNEQIRLGAIKAWKDCNLDLGNQYDLARQIQELREANTFHVETTVNEPSDR